GRAERGFREGDRNFDDQVVAAALVQLRWLYPGDDEQGARFAAREAGLPLALQTDAGAVLDARRNLDRVALRPVLSPMPAAARERVLDHGPVAMAARPGLRESEDTRARRDHTAAVTLGADHR